MKSISNILILSVLVQVILCDGSCPSDYKDLAVSNGEQLCQMPPDYGRGAGYPWKFGDGMNLNGAKKRCQKANPTLGCEQWGAVIYPKCKLGYVNSACCLCTPQCPSGWNKVTSKFGQFCQKSV